MEPSVAIRAIPALIQIKPDASAQTYEKTESALVDAIREAVI